MGEKVGAIVVSHNSREVLGRCVAALRGQSHPLSEIVIVDSGSDDSTYLEPFSETAGVRVVKAFNVGFSRANNLGLATLGERLDLVLFLNPDTFLLPDSVALACRRLREQPQVGILSGRLLGFDLEVGRPSGLIDSCGIFRKWYGRWYDRGQGQTDHGQFVRETTPPALCGALLFCRWQLVEELGRDFFDPDFFLYKEDIELCLRVRKMGWQLDYWPELVAYHCRGWGTKRKEISRELRLLASENEILLYRKHPSPYMAWAFLKYLLVRFFGL